jgi:hypothetical protein
MSHRPDERTGEEVKRMYKRHTVDELASTLGIKKKVLEADIRDMGWLWEETTADMGFQDPLSALDVLNAIAKAYIRGRNCRMGSYQALWRHLPTKAALMYCLAGYVSEKNSEEGFALFPKLRACGVTSADGFLTVAGRMSTERWHKHEEQERRQKEKAKERGKQKVRELMEKLKKERGKQYDILEDIRRMVDDERS